MGMSIWVILIALILIWLLWPFEDISKDHRGNRIKHITPDGTVYVYKGYAWVNPETGKTYEEENDD